MGNEQETGVWSESAPEPTRLEAVRTEASAAAPTMPGLPGQVERAQAAFAGYVILEELGRGGMGVVYKAMHVHLKRLVALKMILSGAHAGTQEMARFRAEAEAVARLQHPNIVQIYEVGEEEGRPYFSLEFVSCGSLAQRMATSRVPVRRAAEFVETLAQAMQFAHEHGIVHRDLKPANILLDSEDSPKITDFGLAKQLDHDTGQTQTGTIMGTPSYMSPEQAEGRIHDIGPLSDVYALGVLLFELLTGTTPFSGPPPVVLYDVAHKDPPALRSLNRQLPRDLETIALKCLAKKPERRYRTAGEMAADLRRWLANEPILARPTGLGERVLKWMKRQPAIAASVLAGLVALAGLFIGIVLHNAQLGGLLRLAEERRIESEGNRADAEREQHRAVANLYGSLVREARALRLARGGGYRTEAWHRLQEALRLNSPDKDIEEIRHEAAACLGDFVGLEPAVWKDFSADIISLALLPGAEQIAFGLRDGTLLVRERATSAELARWSAHRTAVGFLASSADGARLVSAEQDGTVKVWMFAMASGWTCQRTLQAAPLRNISPDLPLLSSVALTADGRRLATASENAADVALWNLDTGTIESRLTMPGLAPNCLAFNADGSLLAVGQFPRLVIWDVAARQIKHALTLNDLTGLYALTFSADKQLLACACNTGIALFDTATFQRRFFVRGDKAFSVAFSPVNQTLVFPSYQHGVVRLWNASSNGEIAALKHPSAPHAAAYSPDGKVLAMADTRSLRLWHLDGSGEKLVLPGHSRGVAGVAFSPNGKQLATSSNDGSIKIWNADDGKLIRLLPTLPAHIESVVFSPDGRLLVSGDWAGGIRFWDTTTWQQLAKLEHDLGNQIWCLTFRPDGREFAASGSSGVGVWRVAHAAASQLTLDRVEGPAKLSNVRVRSLCYSRDGRQLAWVDFKDNALHRADLLTAQTLGPPALRLGGNTSSIDFAGEENLLAAYSITGKPELWDLAAGRATSSFDEGGFAARLRITPSRRLAVSGNKEWLACRGNLISLWDLRQRRFFLALPEERIPVQGMAWSPDGKRLAVGSFDGALAIWNLPKIREQLAAIGLGW